MTSKRELTSYIFFGILTTLINILSYVLLTNILGIDYKTATTIAWLVSVLFAFITNKLFVFHSMSKHFLPLVKELGAFILSRVASYGLDILTMITLIELLYINDFVAKIFANFVVVVFNYIISKYFVFRQVIKE
ncbi:MAG: teichoic acid glycosylation protein [Gracilibacter sp. BRH_c7a]|nr:MAG: teichoic acid glycosylation protein [Gracilibacter sp. BRH_c7a]